MPLDKKTLEKVEQHLQRAFNQQEGIRGGYVKIPDKNHINISGVLASYYPDSGEPHSAFMKVVADSPCSRDVDIEVEGIDGSHTYEVYISCKKGKPYAVQKLIEDIAARKVTPTALQRKNPPGRIVGHSDTPPGRA
jgi:hypothetical protein